ncbi:hypothetical protein GQ651_00855 [Alphaproteobacteria bacterium GH1-50]|uniref:Uncharacterized protein n=1 Tax=Kangsaoukella pontilimi TaxID=2691042 RepID=A0A7C9IQV9_9RHOB|nr:hypothetical protein [Kangsaoukella pontilimi]MXQ06385.1 hypothetical protein [Kangsaoukella pontilimi]
MTRHHLRAIDCGTPDELRARMVERVATLSTPELSLVLEFAEQIVTRFDPETVAEFMAWRSDPRIESILQIAAALDEAGRDQLLFDAEHRIEDETRV